MNKEELLQFLKDNLRLDISQETEIYSQAQTVTIKLVLGDDVISEGWVDIDTGDPQQI